MGISETGIKINLPASKSIVNRALIIEKLSGKRFINKKDISCDDTKVLSQVLSLLKSPQIAQINTDNNFLKVDKKIICVNLCNLWTEKSNLWTKINIKNSATAMRFMAAFLTQKVGNWLLIGSESMQSRPIDTLVNALRTLGADIEYCGEVGFLPIKICTKTPLNPQNAELTIENSNSSQTVSALMLIAPNFDNGLKINVKNCASFPYILLTKKIMEDCGAEISLKNDLLTVLPCYGTQITQINMINTDNFLNKICVNHKKSALSACQIIESDWSAAAFWYAFLAINEKHTKITLTNLFPDSYQPDSIVKNIFEKFGIKSVFEENSPRITRINTNLKIQNTINNQQNKIFKLSKAEIRVNSCNSWTLKQENFDFDFENYPDLVPIMAVTCCALDVKFNFSGVQHLRIKESNRLDALQNELKKCGFLLTQTENSLQWFGEKCTPEKLPKIETYNDHRIAMSFAILKQKIDLEIQNPNVVTKSYKNFWKDYKRLTAC